MNKIKELEFLIDAFRSIPGVGSKNAKRYAIHILNQDFKYASTFAQRLIDAKSIIKKCNLCNNFTTNEICNFCKDNNRKKTLCIVSTYDDFERINDTGSYIGYYFILGGEVGTKNKIKFEDIDVQKIIVTINTLKIEEIIIATSFSINGEATAEYIRTKLKHLNNLSIYRIGFGIPLNANIDYIDDETIKESFSNKRRIG